MATPAKPITPEVEACNVLLEEALQVYMNSRKVIHRSDTYEADHEAHRWMWFTIRHTESVIELARQDLVSFPSAMVLARGCMDVAATVLWVMDPEDPLEREVRWMAKLDEYIRRADAIAQLLEKNGQDIASIKRQQEDIHEKYQRFLTKFPPAFKPPGVPRVDSILESLGVGKYYGLYILASQFVHSGMMGTEIYRWEVGGDNLLIDNIQPSMWYLPFGMCWFSLAFPWNRFLARTGGDAMIFVSNGLEDRMSAALEQLRVS